MKPEIIIAVNLGTEDEAKKFIRKVKDEVDYFKIDAGLFTKTGPSILKFIKDIGKKVFLDLKFHDIPSTVARAVGSCIELGVDICTLHASGGFEMMEAAVKEKWICKKDYPLLLGVTVLTSLDTANIRDIFGTERTVEEQVLLLAQLCKSAGLNGVVASSREASLIKKEIDGEFVVATPGIRPLWASSDEHTRVYTPKKAKEEGVDFIIIGRPVILADDPIGAIRKIKEEIYG